MVREPLPPPPQKVPLVSGGCIWANMLVFMLVAAFGSHLQSLVRYGMRGKRLRKCQHCSCIVLAYLYYNIPKSPGPKP